MKTLKERKSSFVKKTFLSIAFFSAIFIQYTSAQNTYQPSEILNAYYGIKDALIAGNSNDASAKADAFIKATNGVDYKVISEGNINILLKDATAVSESKNINEQRQHFANLSVNVSALAKSQKLSDKPIYMAYCPMKKVYWLSDDKTIKNPYFGNAMPTCGKVVETISE
jgi:hypothetical protein